VALVPGKSSLAVRPSDDMCGWPSQGYFVDGGTDRDKYRFFGFKTSSLRLFFFRILACLSDCRGNPLRA
jgi:hypothetical protein